MAALDPKILKPDLIVPMPKEEPDVAADLPVDIRAIQEQLARLGCYRSTIDGDWGPGSAKALLRYYATKKEAPDNLDPNAALLAKLTNEETVVCQRTESDKTARQVASRQEAGQGTCRRGEAGQDQPESGQGADRQGAGKGEARPEGRLRRQEAEDHQHGSFPVTEPGRAVRRGDCPAS